jgi:hypothetical protein
VLALGLIVSIPKPKPENQSKNSFQAPFRVRHGMNFCFTPEPLEDYRNNFDLTQRRKGAKAQRLSSTRYANAEKKENYR